MVVANRMSTFTEAPPLISAELQKRLKKHIVPKESLIAKPETEHPAWLAAVVAHRNAFKTSVWAGKAAATLAYFQVNLIMQQPYQIMFSKLELVAAAGTGAGRGSGSSSSQSNMRWVAPEFSFCDWSELPSFEARNISVYKIAEHMFGNKEVVTQLESLCARPVISSI